MENEILHLPMVALRGMTVMPGKTVHFDISRERSIQAVQEAMTGNQRIFLTAQKKIETDEPKMEDVYEVGTIAVIQQIAKLPRQIMRVMVTGETRGILKQIEEEDPYLLAEAEVVDESGFEIPDEMNAEAMARGLKDILWNMPPKTESCPKN